MAGGADAAYVFQLERSELEAVIPRAIEKIVALRTEGTPYLAARTALAFGIRSEEIAEKLSKPVMDIIFNQYLGH